MSYRPSLDYPENWNRLRHMVFDRDNYTCQRCGRRTWKPQCHHIKPVKMGGSNHPDNLITVCALCHEEIHKDYILHKYQKYAEYNDI